MEYVHIVRYRHRSWSGSSSLEASFLTIFVLVSQKRHRMLAALSLSIGGGLVSLFGTWVATVRHPHYLRLGE